MAVVVVNHTPKLKECGEATAVDVVTSCVPLKFIAHGETTMASEEAGVDTSADALLNVMVLPVPLRSVHVEQSAAFTYRSILVDTPVPGQNEPAGQAAHKVEPEVDE